MLALSKYDLRIIRQVPNGIADIFHGQVAIATLGNHCARSIVLMIVIDLTHCSTLLSLYFLRDKEISHGSEHD